MHTNHDRMPHIMCGCSEEFINIHTNGDSVRKRRLLGFASKTNFTLQRSNSSKLFSGNAEAENNCTFEFNVEFKCGQKWSMLGKYCCIFLYFLATVEPDTTNGLIY